VCFGTDKDHTDTYSSIQNSTHTSSLLYCTPLQLASVV
jgi:hypothetical protein